MIEQQHFDVFLAHHSQDKPQVKASVEFIEGGVERVSNISETDAAKELWRYGERGADGQDGPVIIERGWQTPTPEYHT